MQFMFLFISHRTPHIGFCSFAEKLVSLSHIIIALFLRLCPSDRRQHFSYAQCHVYALLIFVAAKKKVDRPYGLKNNKEIIFAVWYHQASSKEHKHTFFIYIFFKHYLA